MKYNKFNWLRKIGRFARALLLWMMLISGILLVTRQVHAYSIVFKKMFLAPGSKSTVDKRHFLKALPKKDYL